MTNLEPRIIPFGILTFFGDLYERDEPPAIMAARRALSEEPERLSIIIQGGDEILNSKPLDWQMIRKEANIALESEEESRKWLEGILKIMKQSKAENEGLVSEFEQAQEQFKSYNDLFDFFAGRLYQRSNQNPEDIFALAGLKFADFADKLIQQGKDLSNSSVLPLEALNFITQQNLKSEEDAREWLKKMINIMEDNRPNK